MLLRLARWWLVVVGGMCVGGGLVLHGQLAMAHYLREEVSGTFFLWRAIGRLTFFLQDEVTQLALQMDDVPESVLVESDRMAWALTVVGAVLVAVAPLVRRPRTKAGKRP